MRFITILAAAALALPGPTAVVATKNITFVAQQIAQISPCGITCLQQTIPAVGCSVLDTDCQCSNSKLVQITADCMYANCTYLETLGLSKIQAAICERPYESQNYTMRVMTAVCAVVTISSVFLRFLSKFLLCQKYGLDDVFVVIALITECLFTAFGVKLEEHGFGDHVWTIDYTSIAVLFRWFYTCEILYILTIGSVKVSLLFFYLRVFPSRSFRLFCWATMLFCILSSLAFILVTIFQCAPIQFTWDKNIKGGKCLNYNAVAWSNAATNILQDLMIIALPVRETLSLQLSLKQRARLVVMFCVGGFVCVTSLIRLKSLRTFGLTADPTWDNVSTTFWSTLETTAAIFCVCMPAVRAGFVSIFSVSSRAKTQNMNNLSHIRLAETDAITKPNTSKRLSLILTNSLPRTKDHLLPIELLVRSPATTVVIKPVHNLEKGLGCAPSYSEKPLPKTPE